MTGKLLISCPSCSCSRGVIKYTESEQFMECENCGETWKKPNIETGEDIALWCDGTWCYRDELESMSMIMSDDYSIVESGTADWKVLVEC